jgi:DNA invertase Pin-like site-specific DNA recombinase
MRAALYGRVSTADQTAENQLLDIRQYSQVRGWSTVEYVDEGVSGTCERRPALDRLVADAKRRRFDVLVVWRLDRLGRTLSHLVRLLDELTALGIAFVSLNESIDSGTPAGRLQLHLLAAFSEFERSRIVEGVRAGLARARSQGIRLGRPKAQLPLVRLAEVAELANADAAKALGVSLATVKRWRRAQKTLSDAGSPSPQNANVAAAELRAA